MKMMNLFLSSEYPGRPRLPRKVTRSQDQDSPAYLSLVLICRALASILAPISPMPFPLMSTLVKEVLLPRALMMMVTSVLSFESARDRDCRGCRANSTQH